MGKAMRYTSAEKVEIIRLVEESDLLAKRTLDGLGTVSYTHLTLPTILLV